MFAPRTDELLGLGLLGIDAWSYPLIGVLKINKNGDILLQFYFENRN